MARTWGDSSTNRTAMTGTSSHSKKPAGVECPAVFAAFEILPLLQVTVLVQYLLFSVRTSPSSAGSSQPQQQQVSTSPGCTLEVGHVLQCMKAMCRMMAMKSSQRQGAGHLQHLHCQTGCCPLITCPSYEALRLPPVNIRHGGPDMQVLSHASGISNAP